MIEYYYKLSLLVLMFCFTGNGQVHDFKFFNEIDSTQFFDFKIVELKNDSIITNHFPIEGLIKLENINENHNYIFLSDFNDIDISYEILENKKEIFIHENNLTIGLVELTSNFEYDVIGNNKNGGGNSGCFRPAVLLLGQKTNFEDIGKKIHSINIYYKFFKNSMFESTMTNDDYIDLVIVQTDSLSQSPLNILLEKRVKLNISNGEKGWIHYKLSNENLILENYKYLYFGIRNFTPFTYKRINRNKNDLHSCISSLLLYDEMKIEDISSWRCTNKSNFKFFLEVTK